MSARDARRAVNFRQSAAAENC